MYFDFQEDPLPSQHISSKKISFILGDGLIESAVEDDKEKVKKEEKKNKKTSYDVVINFTLYNEKQEKKTYFIDTFYGFIVSLFKF